MNVRLLLLTVPVALALTACGTSSPNTANVASAGSASATPTASANPSAPTDQREAQLKFAQCMREHGVDMKDPEPNGGIRIEAKGDKATTDKAMKECEPIMSNVVGDRVKQDPGQRDQMLKFAQCMREHGIPMKDPGTDGKFVMEIPKGSEKKMEAAQEACKEFAPNFGGGK